MQKANILQISPSMPGDLDPEKPLAANEDAFLAILDEAAQFNPDFVSFYELTLPRNTNRSDRPLEDVAHPLPGPFIDRVGDRAAMLDSYVWVPTYERDGDDIYNSVGLVGPDGQYLGSYRKVAPTIGEIENRGVTPGAAFPVWDTEFGRVGATICWDVRFDDIALNYRAQDIDIMFHPTRGLGLGKLGHWATYHGFHIAYCWTKDRRVYTPHGNVVGGADNHPSMPSRAIGNDASAHFSPVTINTDMRSYNAGTFNYGDTELNRVQRTYPEEVVVHKCHGEGIIVLESIDPDLSIEAIEEEFDLSTNESAEYRTRELVADAVSDSPLLGPETFQPDAEMYQSIDSNDDG